MNSGAGPSGSFEEFSVRIPRDGRRKFSMMKYGNAPVDFSKLGEQPVKMERENNFREYKTAHDMDTMPKFGAGSEYGKDLKEESRRKKYGIMRKRYDPENQPWLLKIGSGKQMKKYKGVREGSISENTSYYIFTKAYDGAFEAYPVQEWYNFTPQIKYKYLNSEEAEEEFLKRDKTLNMFNIMLKKKYQKDEDADDEEEEMGKKKGGKSKKKKKDLQLTDMEDWDDLAMSDDDDDDDSDKEGDDNEAKKSKKKVKKDSKKKKSKNAKHNSDDEAIEESDEGDVDDREVDYMSDSGSSSSAFSGDEEKEKKGDKYDDKGVDQEAGLKNILNSEDEDEEEEEKEKDDADEDKQEKDDKKEEKKKGADDSSSSSSEDDSDIEKDANKLAKELLLEGDKKVKKEKKEKTDEIPETSVKTEPEQTQEEQKDKVSAGLKRKPEKTPDSKPPMAKKHKLDDTESLLEDDLRRYLQRKPMTTKTLLQKFKSKKLNMSNERIQQVIVQLLKKINPDKTTINKQLFLSLKAPE